MRCAVVLGAVLAYLLLLACAAPTAAIDPTCQIQPLATGEKVIPLAISTPPPPYAHAGQAIELGFSGGYVIPNNAVVCEGEATRTLFSDELPGWSDARKVALQVGELRFGQRLCGDPCTITATLPPSIEVGVYPLYLLAPLPVRAQEFELFIVPAPTP